MEEQAVRVTAPSGFCRRISARVFLQRSALAVVVAHPWGPLGGSMWDITVRQVVGTFASAGCTTARFNFRSGFGRGYQSIEDVVLVSRYLLDEVPESLRPKKILVVGYSYGSIAAGAAVSELPECIGFALIAPPIDVAGPLYFWNHRALLQRIQVPIRNPSIPKFFLLGDRDQFCTVQSFNDFVEEVAEPKSAQLLPGVDHFMIFRSVSHQLTEWVRRDFGVANIKELNDIIEGQAAAASEEADNGGR